GLGEGAALAGGADQYGGPCLADYFLEGDAPDLLVPLPVGDLVGGTGVGELEVAQPVLVAGDEAVAVHGPEAPGGLLAAQALRDHRVPQLVGDAHARRTGPEDHDAVLGQRQTAGPYAGQDRGE